MSRLRVGNGLGQGEICRSAVCFELASRLTGVRVDRSKIARLSGHERAYGNAFTMLSRALPSTRPSVPPLRALCVQFGCARIEGTVQRALENYKQRFVASLPPERRANVYFGDRAVFQAAAFYLVARKHKLKVEREQLLIATAVDPDEFDRTLGSMQALCGNLAIKKTVPKKGRAEGDPSCTEKESESELEELASDAEEVPGIVNAKKWAKKRRAEEYNEWKDSVVQNRPKKMTLSKLRQATLSFANPSTDRS